MERFKLDPTRQCRTYSKGNQQKVALIAALVSNVELFILDEPTLGLDLLMEAIFRECVAEVKRAGATVLLSSHILSEVEALCDRISIINEGRIVETGSLAERVTLHVLLYRFRPVDRSPDSPGYKAYTTSPS